MIRLSIDPNLGNSKNPGKNGLAMWIVLPFALLLIGGCSSVPAPTPTPPQSPFESTLDPAMVSALAADAAVAVPALIVAERTASAATNLAILSSLWHPKARIVDGRDTSDPADDYIWQDRAAILDRYELAVFPNPPPLFEATPMFDLVQDGLSVTVVNGVDEWQFVYEDGRWWITELAYQRP